MKDLVNHPEHYTTGGIECIDAMESFMSTEEFVGHCKACAFKYIWRCGKKDVEIQELSKAKWYIDKALKVLENEKT